MKQINKKYKNSTKVAYELANSNFKIVYKVVHDRFKGMQHDNLISVGMQALIDSAYNYDFESGIKFSTYAYSCVYLYILTYLRKEKRNKQSNLLIGDFSDENKIIREINAIMLRDNETYKDLESMSNFHLYEIGWELITPNSSGKRSKPKKYKANKVVRRLLDETK